MSENIEFQKSTENKLTDSNINTMALSINDQICKPDVTKLDTNESKDLVQENEIVQVQDAKKNTDTSKEEKKTARVRCEMCKARLTLASQIPCKCGNCYCSVHRNSFDHNCTFDYKSMGRTLLEKANVKVIADKVNKI